MIKYLLCVFALLTFGDCQQCDDGYTLVRGKCFLPYNYIRASWNDAQQLCNLENATLALLDDCALYGDLVRFIHVSGYESEIGYWVGATDMEREGSWQWTNGNILSSNVPFWGVVDDVDEPGGGISQNCAILYAGDHYLFHDDDCDIIYNFLCQKEPLVEKTTLVGYSEGSNIDSNTVGQEIKSFGMQSDEDLRIEDQTPKSGNCSNGFTFIRDSCFYFQTEFAVSWPDSAQFCQSINSRLAVLKDCALFFDVSTYISDNVAETSGTAYWIGAMDLGEEYSWSWVDFSPVVLGTPFWASYESYQGPSSEADGNCVSMLEIVQQHRFLDASCDEKRYAVCQQDPF